MRILFSGSGSLKMVHYILTLNIEGLGLGNSRLNSCLLNLEIITTIPLAFNIVFSH